MTETTNTTAVRRFLELQYEGDIEGAFRRHAHPDFQWVVSTRDHDGLRDAIPWAGYTLEGKSGYEHLVGLLFGEFEPLEFTTTTFTDAGDRVFVEGRFVFRHRQTTKLAISDFLARFDLRALLEREAPELDVVLPGGLQQGLVGDGRLVLRLRQWRGQHDKHKGSGKPGCGAPHGPAGPTARRAFPSPA